MIGSPPNAWMNAQQLGAREMECGFCNRLVGATHGYTTQGGAGHIYLCPNCRRPTYTVGNDVFPVPSPGGAVQHLPEDVAAIYDEARLSAGAGAPTAAVLACRKLLMNLGVNKGAEENKPFVYYVQFLSDKGYVPPDGKHWVDHIRDRGNDATHEIAIMKTADAAELIEFTQMLLRFIYEFPNRVPKKPLANSAQQP